MDLNLKDLLFNVYMMEGYNFVFWCETIIKRLQYYNLFLLFFNCCMQLQIVVWFVIPAIKDSTVAHVNHTLSLIVLIQYIPRLFQIFPLQRRILKTSGLIAKTALAGALYNLGFYMLASHVILLFIENSSKCQILKICNNSKNIDKLCFQYCVVSADFRSFLVCCFHSAPI